MKKPLKFIFITLIFLTYFQSFKSNAQSETADKSEYKSYVPAGAQEVTLLRLRQQFMIDSANINMTPMLSHLANNIDSIAAVDSVAGVDIRGYASIDGPVTLNDRLAKARAIAMADWLRRHTSLDSAIYSLSSYGNDWSMFERIVKNDPDMPMKSEVMEIITSHLSDTAKQNRLRGLDEGAVWKYMAAKTFPEMRMAEVDINGYHTVSVKLDNESRKYSGEIVEEIVEEVMPEEAPAGDYWTRKIYVKSNAPAWLMLWINAAFEIDLAPHWSAAIPIYYSGFNYFTSKLKFRTFSVVPEVRWWPREDNMGFFVNAHLGLNQFNYAKGGDWRYQTYHGHSPALGGGVGIGYRWYFCKNHRWSMEAALGAGVYHLDYSIFQNIPNGLIVGRRIRTFFGIDQAALSFAYSFGVQRKEVKR